MQIYIYIYLDLVKVVYIFKIGWRERESTKWLRDLYTASHTHAHTHTQVDRVLCLLRARERLSKARAVALLRCNFPPVVWERAQGSPYIRTFLVCARTRLLSMMVVSVRCCCYFIWWIFLMVFFIYEQY